MLSPLFVLCSSFQRAFCCNYHQCSCLEYHCKYCITTWFAFQFESFCGCGGMFCWNFQHPIPCWFCYGLFKFSAAMTCEYLAAVVVQILVDDDSEHFWWHLSFVVSFHPCAFGRVTCAPSSPFCASFLTSVLRFSVLLLHIILSIFFVMGLAQTSILSLVLIRFVPFLI